MNIGVRKLKKYFLLILILFLSNCNNYHKTSFIQLAVGEKKHFGSLEIKALKCELSEGDDAVDTVAYIQVKDLSFKDNNQVFIFNGWTFASSPTLRSIDHPVYDLWITSCKNI